MKTKTYKEWLISVLHACETGSIDDFKKNFNEDCSEPIGGDELIDILNYPEPLTVACGHGHLELVKYLLTSKDRLDSNGVCWTNIHSKDEAAFQEACLRGHMEVVEYLLTSPDLAMAGHTPVNLHADDESGLRLACQGGHLDVVRFLLTSEELPRAGHSFANPNAQVNHISSSAFHKACMEGQWDVVRYLLTSRDLLNAGHTLPDLNAHEDFALRMASAQGNLEMVKYLLTSPELVRAGHTLSKLKDSKWQLRYEVLWNACSSGHWEVVRWLVTECSIKKTKSVIKLSKRHPELAEIFRAQEEFLTLQSSLNEAPVTGSQVRRL